MVETTEGVLFKLKNQTLNQAGADQLFADTKEVKKLLGNLRERDKVAAYFIALDHIEMGDGALSFDVPIIASVAFRDNVYSCQNKELGIISVSPKLEECVKDFEEEILFIWNEYGKEDSAKLTSDAKELKAKILRYIKH